MDVIESVFVGHEPCDACGSSDANCRYDDGHLYCMSCHNYTPPENASDAPKKGSGVVTSKGLLSGSYKALKARKIDEKSCRKFDYAVGNNEFGKPVQIATYRDRKGNRVAQ